MSLFHKFRVLMKAAIILPVLAIAMSGASAASHSDCLATDPVV